jgi:hypothetical protein
LRNRAYVVLGSFGASSHRLLKSRAFSSIALPESGASSGQAALQCRRAPGPGPEKMAVINSYSVQVHCSQSSNNQREMV